MIRKAVLNDVNAIHGLLQLYSKKGELLARPLSKLYDHLRDFWVFENHEEKKPGKGNNTAKNKIVGCCALQFCWEDLAEIRSLAVHPDFTGQKIGTTLAERTIQEAYYFNIKNLFTLTYRPGFFEKFNFSTIDKNELPIKVWSDCIGCVSFPDCDEIAMLRKL